MKALFAAAILALLFCPAFAAQYRAFFLPVPQPYSGLDASSSGHFGSYSVFTGTKNGMQYVAVSGAGVGAGTLARELEYLQNGSRLTTDCNPSDLIGANGTDFVCVSNGWNICPAGSACSLSGGAAPSVAQATVALPRQTVSNPEPIVPNEHTAGSAGATAKVAQDSLELTGAASAQPEGMQLEQILQLVVAFIAVIVASYLILQHQIQLSPQEEKLLDNDTRAVIMQELSGADRIPTDLSRKIGKSKATVVEHLSALSDAGFVERVAEPGKKYVFYRLTRKGKQAVLKHAG